MHSNFYVDLFTTLASGYAFAALGDWQKANAQFDYCKTLIAREINSINDMNTATGLQLIAYMAGIDRDMLRIGDARYYEHALVIAK